MLNNKNIKILNLFKKNVIGFISELILQFPEDSDLLILKLFLENQVDMDRLITGFKKYFTNETNSKMFDDRNEDFFISNNPFTRISSTKFDKLKTIWQSESIGDDDRLVIWNWFELFKKLSLAY